MCRRHHKIATSSCISGHFQSMQVARILLGKKLTQNENRRWTSNPNYQMEKWFCFDWRVISVLTARICKQISSCLSMTTVVCLDVQIEEKIDGRWDSITFQTTRSKDQFGFRRSNEKKVTTLQLRATPLCAVSILIHSAILRVRR